MTTNRPSRPVTAQSTELAAALLVTRDDELVTAVREINDQVGTMTYELEDADPGWDGMGWDRGAGRTAAADAEPAPRARRRWDDAFAAGHAQPRRRAGVALRG